MQRLLLILVMIVVAIPCFAASGYFIVPMTQLDRNGNGAGEPILLDATGKPLTIYGFVFCGSKGQNGVYKITGTQAQLDAVSIGKNITPISTKALVTTTADVVDKGSVLTVETKTLEFQPLTKAQVTAINAVSIGTAKPVLAESVKPDEAVITVTKMFRPSFTLADGHTVFDPDEAVVGQKVVAIDGKPVEDVKPIDPNIEPVIDPKVDPIAEDGKVTP